MGLKQVISDSQSDDLKKSLEAGSIGIFHLKSLWSRKVKQNKSANNYLLNQLDYFVLDGLNMPLAKVVRYLLENTPSFEEFEKWLVLQNGSDISQNTIKKVNDAVIDFCENGQQDYPLKTIIDTPAFTSDEIKFWKENGYIVLKEAVDKEECKELENAIWQYLDLTSTKPQNWADTKDRFWLSEFSHPLLEKNKTSKKIHKAFEQLWGTDKLFNSTHRVSFNPPLDSTIKNYGPSNIHWDISLSTPVPFDLFGMLHLNDVKEEQGAFQCIPRFHKNLDTWLKALDKEINPREEILKEKYQKDIVKVAVNAGDLVISSASLPHGSSINSSNYPRFVHYITMYPPNRRINTIWK